MKVYFGYMNFESSMSELVFIFNEVSPLGLKKKMLFYYGVLKIQF